MAAIDGRECKPARRDCVVQRAAFVIGLFVTAVLVALKNHAQHERFVPCNRGISVAIIAGTFALGRADLLMHRTGAYLRTMEKSLPAQGWKASRWRSRQHGSSPSTTFLGLSLWLYLLLWAEREAARQLTGRARTIYMAITIALVMAGVVSIVTGALT